MSFADYYQKKYGITVRNMKQPLLKVIGTWKKEIKDEKLSKIPEYIYLVPEFVSLTGMTD